MLQYLTYAGIGIVIVALQVLVSPLLSIAGVSPDFLLIFLVWITIKEGQFAGEIYGFAFGLLLDIISSNILGTHALSKRQPVSVSAIFSIPIEPSKIFATGLFCC